MTPAVHKPAPGLGDFTGRWLLHRRIEDRRAGRRLCGRGQGIFTADGAGGLIYDETVVLDIPGHGPLTGKRRYLWRPDGAGIAVLFADGRAFHGIAPRDPAPCALHHCAPDRYEGQYEFARWPDWTARWTVRGPRKDYLAETRFRRPSG